MSVKTVKETIVEGSKVKRKSLSKRWSTVSDHQYFKRIPDWKKSTKEKNKYDM